MRHGLLVVALAAIAVTLVHLRRGELRARYEMHRHTARQATLQRDLLDQQIRLSELTSPVRIRQTAEVMALGLTERSYVAATGAARGSLAARPR